MIIRSQDKGVIINFDNICQIRTGGLNEDRLTVFADDLVVVLGQYSNKEKAIKVLDMIQKQYSHCVAGNIFMNGRIDRINEMASDVAECCVKEHINMQVFQMPQDSEVEA